MTSEAKDAKSKDLPLSSPLSQVVAILLNSWSMQDHSLPLLSLTERWLGGIGRTLRR